MADDRGPPRYGAKVTHDEARRIMAAAMAHARERGWPMAIAIVDPAGLLVMFERDDEVQLGSVEVAIGKARTAALFRRPTKVFEDAIAAGGIGHRILTMPGVLALEGGLPIWRDGMVVGGIGVSGMRSGDDAEVGRAGIEVLGGG